VVTNYLSNASKYTPAGGQLRIEAAPVGAFARVAVTDTGYGIAPEDQAQLFQRFYRVNDATTREIGGTGLGLAIVKLFVELHGGEVGVESELERGSTFSFTVPLSAVDTSSVSAPGADVEFVNAVPSPTPSSRPVEDRSGSGQCDE
jgi:signal transduction histidine kinase